MAEKNSPKPRLNAHSGDANERAPSLKLSRGMAEFANDLEVALQDISISTAWDPDIADARRQLGAVADATDAAVAAILDAAEAIERTKTDISDGPSRAALDKALSDIFVACGFQDLNGQRVTMLMEKLDAVDRRITAIHAYLQLRGETFVDTAEAKPDEADGSTLHGPALPSEANTQQEIDHIMDLVDVAAKLKAKR